MRQRLKLTAALWGAVLACASMFDQASASALPATASAAGEEVVNLEKFEVFGSSYLTAQPLAAATRLALTPRETAQSISVIDSARLQLESLFSVDDALRNVTGVHVAFYDSQRPLYFARGFQITEFQIDGMPTYSGSTNQEYDTALYDRIEIVRGANGLLTGAGNPSAVVNLVRKRPAKIFGAASTATVGCWDFYRGTADASVPLSRDGRVRSRFVLAGQTADSFRERYSDDKYAYLATVEADLTAATTLGVGYQFQDNDPTAPLWGVIPRYASDGSLANLPRSTNFSTNWTEWERESGTAFFSLEQKLGETWKLHAVYNRTEGETYSLRVYANGNPNRANGAGVFLLAGLGETEDTRDSLDVYAAGKFPLFGRDHDLVLGWNLNNLESVSPTFASITFGPFLYRYDIPDYRTYRGDAPRPTVQKTGASRTTITDQNGFYATARLRPLDALALILGARLSSWKTETLNYNTTGVFTGRTGAFDVSGELTPYLGIVYDLSNVWSAYASYTDIFRPQNLKDKTNELLSPVLGSNLEAGLKAEFFAKRFQVSLGVFETRQDNYGVLDATVPLNSLPDGSSAYLGVDGTESRGVEFELSGAIKPRWRATIGYSNINTRRHPLDLTYANVPEHLVRFQTQYQFAGTLKNLTAGLGVNWQGPSDSVTPGAHPTLGIVQYRQGDIALVNLNASYRLTKQLTLIANVRNALDETYWATLDYPNYGEPRFHSLTLRWQL